MFSGHDQHDATHTGDCDNQIAHCDCGTGCVDCYGKINCGCADCVTPIKVIIKGIYRRFIWGGGGVVLKQLNRPISMLPILFKQLFKQSLSEL